MEDHGSLIVGYSFHGGAHHGVLVVGRKQPNQDVDIINAFSGKEAEELYLKLITKKENSNGGSV